MDMVELRVKQEILRDETVLKVSEARKLLEEDRMRIAKEEEDDKEYIQTRHQFHVEIEDLQCQLNVLPEQCSWSPGIEEYPERGEGEAAVGELMIDYDMPGMTERYDLQKTYADFVELYLNMLDEPDDMHTIAVNAKKEFNLASAEAHAFPEKLNDNLKHWWTRTWKVVKSVRS